MWKVVAIGVFAAAMAPGLEPREVVVVANGAAPVSRSIAEYYARKRGIAAEQICYLRTSAAEEIDRATYDRDIAKPVGEFLKRRGWVDRILCLVTTSGVPLKIRGTQGMEGEAASVDAELAGLYQDLKGQPHSLRGPLMNPYYRAGDAFRHPRFPVYLVTRLAGYTFADVKAAVDRASEARDRGVVVLDARGGGLEDGDLWLRMAANRLPRARVKLDESEAVLAGIGEVIGYASWGSNDSKRAARDIHMGWLPGALATEYVSTNGRTFMEPPAGWSYSKWGIVKSYWMDSPQSLTADLIRQGATGASGHVYEPFLGFTPRPDYLFPAYLGGRTLAESFWTAIPAVSWMNIVVGDPLCKLAR